MRRHPTPDELTTWMRGGPGERIGSHLDDCTRCADVCAELVDDAEQLAVVMTETLAADEALEDRVLHGVETSLVARSTAESFLGLIGLGIETAKIILGEEES